MSLVLQYATDLSRVRLTYGDVALSNPGFEVDTAGWFATNGTLTRSATQAFDGDASGELDPDSLVFSVLAGVEASAAPPVTPGWSYTWRVWVYVDAGWHPASAVIAWLDDTDSIIQTDTGPDVAVPAGVWTELTLTSTAPAGAAKISPRVRMTDSPSDPMFVDAASIVVSPADELRVERSTNQLHWRTVRGGASVQLPAGELVRLDDYEFALNAENFYRLVDVSDESVVASGSITPTVGDCEIWLKSVRYPSLNQRVDIADYSDLEQAGRVGVHQVQGRSTPVATTDVSGGLTWDIVFRTEGREQNRKLMLTLAVGDIFYLQIPPDGNPRFPPRSMYLVVTSTTIRRLGVDTARHFPARLVEVAAPSPQVVGTTLTWGTVWEQFGDWEQLWNAEPTWSDLWDLVDSPDDLVVI